MGVILCLVPYLPQVSVCVCGDKIILSEVLECLLQSLPELEVGL